MTARKPFRYGLAAALLLAGAAWATAYTADIQGGTQFKQTAVNSTPAVCADAMGTTVYQACMFGGLPSTNYNPLVQANDSALIFNAGAVGTGSLFVGPHSSNRIGWRMTAAGLLGLYNTNRLTFTNNTSALPLNSAGAGVWAMNSGTGGTSFVAADSSGNPQASLIWDGSLSHLTQNSATAFTWNTSYTESVLPFGIAMAPSGTFRFETADAIGSGDAVGKIGQTFPLFLRSNWPTIGFNEYSNGTSEIYGSTNYAGNVQFDSSGNINLETAPSGTSGSVATMTTHMQLLNAGSAVFTKNTSTIAKQTIAGNYISLANSTANGGGAYNILTHTGALGAQVYWDDQFSAAELYAAPAGSLVIVGGSTAGGSTVQLQPNSSSTSGAIYLNSTLGTYTVATPGSGSFCVVASGTTADCSSYGLLGITRAADAAADAYFSMTKAGTIAWQLGISSANHMIIGPTTTGALITQKFDLDSSGNLALTGSLSATAVTSSGLTSTSTLTVSSTSSKGSCTLNGASPSVCTATVTSGCNAVASNVGTGVALAWSPNVSVSGTTLTIHGANGATNVVNYHCF